MLLAGSFWAYVVVRLVGYRGNIMAAAWNKDAYQTPIQRRHAGTGLDYESYARWLRVGTVVFGLGAAIATGSGVASASTDDADHSPNASSSQAAGDESDGGSVANDTSSDTNAAGRDDDSDQNTADDADEVDESLADELADDESADDVAVDDVAADDVAADEAVDDEAVDDDAAANSDVDPDSDAASGEDAPATEDLEAVTDTKAASSDEDADETHTVQIEPVRQQTTPAEDVDAGEEAAETGQTGATAQASRSETTPTTTYTTTLPDSATTLRSTAASAAAVGRQQEAVTLNAIVTDIFHWVGLGSQAGDLPVPATPVSMLVQSLWLFVRDVQYTWNNQRPNAAPTISGRGPDGTITGSLNAVDYDDANLTYIVTAQPGHGTVSVDAEGNFTYTPADGTVAGTDTFTVTIDDRVGNPTHFHGLLGLVGAVGPRQAVIRVSLTDSALPTEGRQSDAITLKSVVTDVLHWVGLGSVANRLTLSERAVSPGFESLWRFVRELAYHNDNQRPTANPTTVGQGPDGTVTGTLNAVDYDDLTLSYTVSGAPAHGSVTVDANGDFVYVPDAATAASGGTDRFTVVIDDTVGTPTHYRGILGRLGLLGPRRVTVSVRVEPIGPQTIGDGYAVDGTDPDTGVVTGSTRLDNAGTVPLTYVVDPTSGRGGTVTVDEDGRFTYTPSADARHAAAADGATPDQLTDTFTIVATDGYGGVTTVAVTVAIDPANTAPVATVQTTSRDETGAVTGTVTVTDPDGDSAVVTAPASTAKGGTVVFDTATGQFSYTPSDDARHAAAADGASPDDLVDTFAVTVDDGHGGTTVVPVTVTLVPVNADPVATVTVGARDENGVVTGTVSATDADGDAPRFSGPATSAKGGTITVDALTGEFTYTPSEEARHAAAADDATAADRTDTFLLTAADGHGGTAEVLVVVTLDPVNTPLSAGVGSVGSADPVTGQVTGSITVTDPDGDAPAFTTPVTSAKGGTVSIDENGVFTYIPTETARHAAAADNATADDLTDTFDITVNDGHGGTTTLTISVAIDPANTAPTTSATVGEPDTETGAVTGTVAVTDPDGDTATYTVSPSAKGGTVTIDENGVFTYTPTEAARHAAAADNATADDLTDTFDITVNDGHGGTTTLTISVAIDPANTAPTTSATVGEPDTETGAVTGTVAVTDPDGDTATYTVSPSAKGGTVTIDENGVFTYTPTEAARHAAAADNATADDLTDTFDITVNDGHGGTTTQTITVAIDPANAAPTDGMTTITGADTATGQITGTVAVTDPDGDTTTYSASTSVKGGTVTIDSITGEFTYTPTEAARHAAAADNATADDLIDTFAVTVDDGHGGTAIIAVIVNIDPANAAPSATYTVGSFNNGDFAVDLSGWTVVESVVRLDGTGTIAGWPTPIDPTTAPDGGTETTPLSGTYVVRLVDGRVVLESTGLTVPNTPAGSGGVVHGPAVVSNDPVRINSGATVQFDWEASGGADAYDVLGYILNVDTGGTSIILDATGATYNASQPVTQVNYTVTETGNFVFVFVAGTWDATRGQAAGARLSIDNVKVLNNSGANPGQVTGLVNGVDPDGDTLTYSAPATTALGGAVTIDSASGQFTYTASAEARHAAAAGGSLIDTFEVTVTDGHGGLTTVVVSAPIEPANTAPAVTSTVDAPNAETGAVTGMIVVSDADGDSPAFTVSPSAKGGTVTIDPVTGRFTYPPTDAARHAAAADDAPVAERTDTFAVTVDDGHGGTTTTTVSVAIAPANSAPTTTTTVGDPDSVTGAVTGTITASDADGDTLTYAVSPTAKGGTIVVDEATGEFVYLPTRSARDAAAAADADADDLVDTFDITVNDGHGGITSVTVTVAVSPRPNTAPDSLSLAFSGSDEDLITYLRANQAAAPASPAGGRNVISAGDLFLGGNFIEIGLSQKGSFGTSSNKPAGFFATAGSNRLGLSNDVDGFGNGVDSRIDFFMPGTPEERWSVGYNDTQSGGFSALTGDGGTAGALTGVSLSDGSTGDTLSGTFVATVGGVLQTVQVHTFKVNDSFFQTVVTLTNVSDATLTNVEYMRSFDPDNTVYQGGDFVTTNTVRGQFTTDGVAAVTATSAAGDNYENLTGQQATILYLSNDPGALVYTGGFANSDPYAFDSVDQPTGFSQSGDQAIGIIFKAGDLAAGESATFTYYTALSTDENVSAVVSRINTASVTEGSPGAAVGMVTANDPDPDEILTFTVSDARFEVVPSGGTNILKLRDEIALDYAAEPTVTLSITATDTVGASISQVFTINVLEGNVVTL